MRMPNMLCEFTVMQTIRKTNGTQDKTRTKSHNLSTKRHICVRCANEASHFWICYVFRYIIFVPSPFFHHSPASSSHYQTLTLTQRVMIMLLLLLLCVFRISATHFSPSSSKHCTSFTQSSYHMDGPISFYTIDDGIVHIPCLCIWNRCATRSRCQRVT